MSTKSIGFIYDKYYSSIKREDFDKIVESDPTSGKDKVGVHCKWLLDLYKYDRLLLEDLYKATEYLKIYQKFKHLIKADFKNLKSLLDLYVLVEPFEEKENAVFLNDEERKLKGQFKEVFKNSKYRIIIPLTLEASKYFGKGTQWCTVNTNQFNYYTKNQSKNISIENLYIFFTENLKDRLQFHFKNHQFMDVKDKLIDIIEFSKQNQDIYNFFDYNFSMLRYTNPYEFYKRGERLTENDKNAVEFLNSILVKLTKTKNDEYPKSVFYIDVEDGNKIYMEADANRNLWCLNEDFFHTLNIKFDLGFLNSKIVIKNMVCQYFKLEEYSIISQSAVILNRGTS